MKVFSTSALREHDPIFPDRVSGIVRQLHSILRKTPNEGSNKKLVNIPVEVMTNSITPILRRSDAVLPPGKFTARNRPSTDGLTMI
jgi:hypothetical protein